LQAKALSHSIAAKLQFFLSIPGEILMPQYLVGFVAAASATLIVGCATVVVAPGADKIRLTVNAADVTTCKAVGNIKTPEVSPGLVNGFYAEKQFRNLAVGLGSDVALVTEGTVSIPVTGIGYRCF
jgi:hypothetical protein